MNLAQNRLQLLSQDWDVPVQRLGGDVKQKPQEVMNTGIGDRIDLHTLTIVESTNNKCETCTKRETL